MAQRRSTRERFTYDTTWPACYRSGEHSQFVFERGCTACSLSNMHHTPPQQAVANTAPDDLSQVKLIVISDYPGNYEVELGFNMVDNQRIEDNNQPLNAGASIRWLLRELFSLDTYQDVFWTNAVRCSRGEGEVKLTEVSKCVKTWLAQDFQVLSQYAPQAPVLIAGNHAFRACKVLDPESWKNASGDLHSYRRQVNSLLGRPTVVTINPAPLGRSLPKLETGLEHRRNGTYKATGVYAFPLLPGSAEWHVREDLKYLALYLH